jgi:thioredoxin 1
VGVEVFAGVGSGPLVVAAGAAGAVLTVADQSAIDPVTGRTSMFVRVVQIGEPDDPAGGAGVDPVLRLGVAGGPLVAVGAGTPITAQAGGDPVAVATVTAEGRGIYLVEVEVLESQPRWALQIANPDNRGHRYTGVLAGSKAATSRGWLDVVSASVSFDTLTGQSAPAQQVVIANYGTAPLSLADADGTDLGSGFRLVSVTPRPIGPNQRSIATIGFSAPATPATPATVHDFASDDPTATDTTGHNKRLTLRATVRPRGGGTPINVTDDSFDDDVLKSPEPVLVDFWATWCGPCRMVAPVLEEIAAEKAGELRVAKLDVDANPETPRDFQVVSIPTMILFKNGKAVKRIVGAKGKAALLRELSDVFG